MKTDGTCDEVRYRLALGTDSSEESLQRHLGTCPACSREAAWIEGLGERLAHGASVEPGPMLDAVIRSMLRDGPAARAPFHRASIAAGLAGAGFLALILGLGIVFAQGGLAEGGLSMAMIVASIYLGVSAVALSPLLFFARIGEPVGSPEVGP